MKYYEFSREFLLIRYFVKEILVYLLILIEFYLLMYIFVFNDKFLIIVIRGFW